MPSILGSCPSLVSKLTEDPVLVKCRMMWRGTQKPIFPSCLSFKVCFTHSPYLPAVFSFPYFPFGLSSVMHVIVIVVSV